MTLAGGGVGGKKFRSQLPWTIFSSSIRHHARTRTGLFTSMPLNIRGGIAWNKKTPELEIDSNSFALDMLMDSSDPTRQLYKLFPLEYQYEAAFRIGIRP